MPASKDSRQIPAVGQGRRLPSFGAVQGEYLERLNRFVIVVWVDGKREVAHLPNPGRLLEVLSSSRTIILRRAPKGRKTKWTAVAADLGEFWVSLDSTFPNRAFPFFLGCGVSQSSWNSRLGPRSRSSGLVGPISSLPAARRAYIPWGPAPPRAREIGSRMSKDLDPMPPSIPGSPRLFARPSRRARSFQAVVCSFDGVPLAPCPSLSLALP